MVNMKRTIVFVFALLLLTAACNAAGTDGSDEGQRTTSTVTVYRMPT